MAKLPSDAANIAMRHVWLNSSKIIKLASRRRPGAPGVLTLQGVGAVIEGGAVKDYGYSHLSDFMSWERVKGLCPKYADVLPAEMPVKEGTVTVIVSMMVTAKPSQALRRALRNRPNPPKDVVTMHRTIIRLPLP